jgi:hypothetical protein
MSPPDLFLMPFDVGFDADCWRSNRTRSSRALLATLLRVPGSGARSLLTFTAYEEPMC